MANKSKMAFGQSANIEAAKQANKIDNFDVLLLDGNTEPKIGWIDAQGNTVVVDHRPDLAKVEAELEGQISTKADAEEVNAKIATKVDSEKVESSYEKIKYEITDVPDGTLVNMNEREIRICCPTNTVWTKQTVGEGGDANCYYCTLHTYAPNDNVVGYIEHLGDQVDSEILTDLKTDKYGRKYQPSWLALAKYDETSGTWTYYGVNSTTSKYIGWNYQIDWYDANNKMIASDSIRINLSNENCHSMIKPYYGVSEMTEVETKIDEAVQSANDYTDAQIEAKLAEIGTVYEVIEF